MPEFLCTGAAAEKLGVKQHFLQSLVRSGVVAPQIVSNRRLWTEPDLLAVLTWMEKRKARVGASKEKGGGT
jgi:DNA-binding transcriptional MerR regulator